MAAPKKPNVPTVLKPDAADPTKSSPTSRERIPHVIVPTGQIVKKDGSVDGETLARLLTQIQQNSADATLAHRSDPMNNFVISQGVTLIKGVPTVVRHGLGTPFTYFHAVRQYPTYLDASGKQQSTFSFQGVETVNNTDAQGVAHDPAQFLCLISAVSGKYDIKICA